MSGGQRRVFGAIPYGDIAIETGSDASKDAESHPPGKLRFNSYVRTVSRFSFAKNLAADDSDKNFVICII